MHLVFAEKVGREVFDGTLAFDELLEGADLGLGGFFVLFLRFLRALG